MKRYTVIGLWDDESVLVVAVIEGQHDVEGADDENMWATSVEAPHAAAAASLARDEMEGR